MTWDSRRAFRTAFLRDVLRPLCHVLIDLWGVRPTKISSYKKNFFYLLRVNLSIIGQLLTFVGNLQQLLAINGN